MTSQNGEDTCHFKMQLSYAITLQISRVKLGNWREGGREGGRGGGREGGREGRVGGREGREGGREPGNQLESSIYIIMLLERWTNYFVCAKRQSGYTQYVGRM